MSDKKLEHISDKEISKVLVTKQNKRGDIPKGFWYYLANERELWLKKLPEGKKQIYSVEVARTTLDNPDSTKVLSIKTSNDWDRFTIKYGYPTYVYDDKTVKKSGISSQKIWVLEIKWLEVSQDFAGIEIIPFRNNKKEFYQLSESSKKLFKKSFPDIQDLTIFWYQGGLTRYFEQSCGCVWGKGGLTKCEWIDEIYNKSS